MNDFRDGVMSSSNGQENKTVADNRKARHDYFIEESYEAGLALTGSEIKSLRGGRLNLRGGYARVVNGEIWLHDVHISPYEQSGTHFNHEPTSPAQAAAPSPRDQPHPWPSRAPGLHTCAAAGLF